MKKLISLGSVFFLVLIACSMKPGPAAEEQEKYPTIELGAKIPANKVKMQDISGKEVCLQDIAKEKGLLVIFSCNTCPFVKYWEGRYPMMKKMCDRFNIGFVLVNSNEMKRSDEDSYDAMKKHAAEQKYDGYYTLDKNSAVANAFGAKTTPHVFLFDQYYKLVYKGAIDDNYENAAAVKEHYLMDAISNMVEGKKIETSTTKPVGCSVKRAS
jgi:thioredoxin-related protein